MNTPKTVIKKNIDIEKSPRLIRKELHYLISEIAKNDEEKITAMYNNLYSTYKILTNIDISDLANINGYDRVVQYAEKNGHIEKLFSLAKKIYKSEEEK